MTRKASRRKKKITKYITSVGPDIDLLRSAAVLGGRKRRVPQGISHRESCAVFSSNSLFSRPRDIPGRMD
jgi:hypothetical protein